VRLIIALRHAYVWRKGELFVLFLCFDDPLRSNALGGMPLFSRHFRPNLFLNTT